MRLTHIHVEHFLGVQRASVDLTTPVTVFCGPNAAGKSSIRDGLALALTADLGRVPLKKEAAQLIHGDAASAAVEVGVDGQPWGVTITRAGKIADSRKGHEVPPALPYVLAAQRFARLTVDERRAFLFGLMGVKTDADAVGAKLRERELHQGYCEQVLPLLRAGFETAHKEAARKATEAKGAWRAVTGENWGSQKAEGWRAPVPAFDAKAWAALETEQQHLAVALEGWTKKTGELQAQQRHTAERRQRMAVLLQKAEMLERVERKLATDRAELERLQGEVERTAAQAGAGGARVGLPHDLAEGLNWALALVPEHMSGEPQHGDACAALEAYVATYGPLGVRAGDPAAAARLPELRNALRICQTAVANDERDLAAIHAATAEADAIEAELKDAPDVTAELKDAEAEVDKLKAERQRLTEKAESMRGVKAAMESAEKKTQDAARHHIDVQAWDAIADALSPSGIPAELLDAALGPINDRLAQSATDAEWPQVGIDGDMAISIGQQPYALASESEQWRADAMLAEAIAHASGLRLLVLDRFDVLDLKGRGDLLAWLDILAEQGEIDTALIFGTLKALPTGLPATTAAHWIDGGVLQQPLREAA